jgi:hypothetical protein
VLQLRRSSASLNGMARKIMLKVQQNSMHAPQLNTSSIDNEGPLLCCGKQVLKSATREQKHSLVGFEIAT